MKILVYYSIIMCEPRNDQSKDNLVICAFIDHRAQYFLLRPSKQKKSTFCHKLYVVLLI